MVDGIALAVTKEMQRTDSTITDVAAVAGVDRSSLGRWLSGQRTLRSSDVAKVLAALHLIVVHERELNHAGREDHTGPALNGAAHRHPQVRPGQRPGAR